MRILIDMDGVIADFERGFLKQWQTLHADKSFVRLEDRKTFYIIDDYPSEAQHIVSGICQSSGFFRTLEPMTGAVEALAEMRQMGHSVFICTSPLSAYKNCVLEKFEWVEQHLGADWVKQIVMTKDKTIVTADVLIDDKPTIEGAAKPDWEHIIYDQPYNKTETTRKRLTWQNWKTTLFH